MNIRLPDRVLQLQGHFRVIRTDQWNYVTMIAVCVIAAKLSPYLQVYIKFSDRSARNILVQLAAWAVAKNENSAKFCHGVVRS